MRHRVELATPLGRLLQVGLIAALAASSASLDGHIWRNFGAILLVRSLEHDQLLERKEPRVDEGVTWGQMLLHWASIRSSKEASMSRLMLTLSLARGDLAAAEAWGLKASNEDPKDPVAAFRLGQVYALTGRHDKAIDRWRSVNASSYFLNQVVIDQLAGNWPGAVEAYGWLMALDPSLAPTDMRVTMAWHQYERGNHAGAESELEAAVQNALGDDSDEFLYYAYGELGMYYAREGRWEEAAKALRQAVVLQPEAFHYRLWLGGAYKNLGDMNRAESELQQALQTPDRTTRGYVYANLGEVYMQRRDFARALDAFRKALEVFPNDGRLQEQYEQVSLLIGK